MKPRIGSRGSDLALWQSQWVAAQLAELHGVECEIIVVTTSGDRIQDVPLRPELGSGFFTKEIEEGLLRGDFDIAVHSLKDLAVRFPDGLDLGAVSKRAAAGETLLALPHAVERDADFVQLRSGARVGTSSPRRQRWLKAKRPDLVLDELRGNVPTRIAKLRDAQRYDAIVLASAGLDRLEIDLDGLEAQRLDASTFACCPGQGALGLQIRSDDRATRALRRGSRR